jgi:hypothetical protein
MQHLHCDQARHALLRELDHERCHLLLISLARPVHLPPHNLCQFVALVSPDLFLGTRPFSAVLAELGLELAKQQRPVV